MSRSRLSTDDRREQILAAIGDVVRAHGAMVTSRQLAEAAGVAEGTLFRVFGDKDAILIAFIEREGCRAFDLSAVEERLGDDACLSDCVFAIIEVIVEQVGHYMELSMALGPLIHTAHARGDHENSVDVHNRRFAHFTEWIASLLEPFAAELSVPPAAAAAAISTVAVTASSSWGQSTRPLSLEDTHKILVHGLVARQSTESASKSSANAAHGSV